MYFKVQTHVPQTLLWWNNQRHLIDMKPKYQRESGLWSNYKRAFLMDSIINDYDMPKLYLADFNLLDTELNKTRKPYAVIDGKQRLQAFFSFFDNDLKLNQDFVYQSDPSVKIAGLTYYQIRNEFPVVANKIENHIPVVMSVITDNESKIGQLFVRLNSGVAVNAAERRNAMDGVGPDLIRKLANHKFFREKIRFSVMRMAEFNVAAKLLLIEDKGRFVDTKASNLDSLVKAGLNGDELSRLRDAKKSVDSILDEMVKIFTDNDHLLSAGGAVPVYYWLVRNNLQRKAQIREFLELFVQRLHKNHQIIKTDPESGDPELSQYYTMGRTTNDQASLEGRYRIIEKRFKEFLTQK